MNLELSVFRYIFVGAYGIHMNASLILEHPGCIVIAVLVSPVSGPL